MESVNELYTHIDELKQSLSEENVTEQTLATGIQNALGVVAEEHDLKLLMKFMNSSFNSIREFCNNEGESLLLEANIFKDNELQNIPLDTIPEMNESTSSQSRTYLSGTTIENPFFAEPTSQNSSSINLDTHEVPLADQSFSIEFEPVRMIRMKHLSTGLQSLHRTIFLGVPSASDSQRESLISALIQAENGFATLLSSSFTDISEENRSKLQFSATLVVSLVWQLEATSERAAESTLFSNWKTKVNSVVQKLWKQNALGFADVGPEGLNVYE